MTDPIELRGWVRMVLSALPKNRRASEDLIFAKVRVDFPELRVAELRVAIEWNQIKGYIDYVRNSDAERDEWFLTDTGRQKEGLA